jgi:signal transduction histidine kinase/FixJ family two-component response regulator
LETLNILIVEDNPGDIVIINDLIRSSGLLYKSTHSSTLHETIQICRQNKFDIILLDLGLPDSIGLNTLKQLNSSVNKAPLVVMTGLDDEITALESLREGAQDYLVKNKLTVELILRTIKYSIERKKITDIQKQNACRFSVLSAATGALNECEDISLIFRIINANLMILLDNAYVCAIEFPDTDFVRISGIEWLEPKFDEILRITGKNLHNPIFSIPENSGTYSKVFLNRKLHLVEGGLSEALKGYVDEKSCKALENLLDFNYIYTIGFHQQKLYYGSFMIMSKNHISNEDMLIIETIANHTSLNIHKRRIERHLRMSEDRYKKLNIDLEQKVRDRTKDIEEVNQRLQKELAERIQAEKALKINEVQLRELNATKDKFFNIVAHDLKNPFTSLLGSSELLFENISDLDNDNIKELAVILNNSAKSGYAILQNLLDWSRSQTGMLSINPEHVCLKTIVDENIENQEVFASNKNVTIQSEVDGKIFILTDKNMVNTVLRNLISNALKFSYRKGVVLVKAVTDQNKVTISVKDFGTGIPKDEIDKLFRIDSKHSTPGTENEQGTGLGLKLSKEFVVMQGGTIWVESEENKGSTFSFTIPIKG